jgi:hypothetical protein
MGVLSYNQHVMQILKQHEEYHKTSIENPIEFNDPTKYLVSGSDIEVEIRGNSVYAVELIVNHIRKSGFKDVNAIIVDFYLWDITKEREKELMDVPIHRTRSIYY